MSVNLERILAIEALAAAQGVELRAPLSTSQALQDAIARIRQAVPALGDDRYVAPDLAAAAQLVRSGALVPPNAPRLEPLDPEQRS
jgi:histidine ammonia-lyase